MQLLRKEAEMDVTSRMPAFERQKLSDLNVRSSDYQRKTRGLNAELSALSEHIE